MSKENETNIVSMRDFYNHDTRLALLEKTCSSIEDTLLRINERLDRIDSRLDRMDEKLHSHHRWTLGLIIGGWATTLGAFSGLLAVMAHGFRWII